MSSKEVKSALKAAREAIRNKEFKEAIKQCKSVLAEDKNNYNALVFVGVAAEGLEQYDQALKAYRRATEVSPEQLLAWQGLSTMHSKNSGQVPKEDMVNVYENLIELYENDKEKQEDVIKKLIPLYGDKLDKAVSLYERLGDSPASRDLDVLLHLISQLQKQPSLSPQLEGKLLSCLRVLLSSPDTVTGDTVTDRDTHVRSYLQLLQKREAESVFEECTSLCGRFPSCFFPLEMKLSLLLDRQMETSHEEEADEINKVTSHLCESTSGKGSYVLKLAKGYLSLMEGKYTAARDSLQEGVKKLPSYFCGHFYLAQVLSKLHENAACVAVCQQALLLQSNKSRVVSVNTSNAAKHLRLMAVRCCLQQGTNTSLAQALEYLKELEEGGEEVDVLRAYIFLELGDQDQLQACLDKLQRQESTEVRALLAWKDFHNGNYTEASKKLDQCVKEDGSRADYLLKLGRALWQQRQTNLDVHQPCFNALLKAAKLDPYMSGTFLYLGHFYTELKKDQQRGRKCYQKAYDLDASNEEAGAALCDLMATLGEEESVQSLLQKVTQTASAGSAKWAWLRMGLAQMRTGDSITAASSFQFALRADPTDRHVWECLAEAYLQRGSFTAALKAFSKAVELCPDSIYCLYQMATIKQRLGSLREAVEEYSLILHQSPDYVPALKGLGETYLLLTHHYLDQGLLGLARDHCEKAIVSLTRSAKHRPDLSCLWKLMGDCCTSLHSLHSASFQICVPRALCQSQGTDNTDTADLVPVNKAQFMELATKCYGRAVKILPDSAPLWHDLGLSLFYLCREHSEGEERKAVAEKCLRALKKAVTLDPSHHRHWTALGVVAASPYVDNLALAQHCFIKSAQCETNNAVAWTNLGTLYLRNDNIQLAHEAFKVAQSQEPEYLGCWIGQALVAETVGHEEAMDLFRHTTQLGIHTESCIGYGHWVISTLLDVGRQETESFQYCIKQMAAIPAACDALTRYTEVKKEDPRAFNMLGLLSEHQGLFRAALEAFQRAAELAEKWGIAHDQLTKIRLNLARLLSQNKRYAEAVSVYKTCAETFGDVCQWALALYKDGQLQESCHVYQQALSMAETDRDKSDVCAALGMVAFRAGNMEDAKAALFQGFQLSTPSVRGLLALCALGILQGDATLTQATLQELCGLVKVGDKLQDLPTLTAVLKLSQAASTDPVSSVQQTLEKICEGMSDDQQESGNLSEGVSGIRQLLDRIVANSAGSGKQTEFRRLYLLLARLALLTNCGYSALSAASCAFNLDSSPHTDSQVYASLCQLFIGHHSRQHTADNAIRTAQKAFHNSPDDMSALCCLAGAVHAEAVIQCVTMGSTQLFAREVGLLDLALTSGRANITQKRWCLKQKAVAQLMMNDLQGCLHTLTQIQSEHSEDSEFASVLCCVVNNDWVGLEPLVIRDGVQLFCWQILLTGLMKERRWKEAGVLLREAIHRAVSHSGVVVKLVCLVNIAWLAAQQLMESEGGDGEAALGELEEAREAVGKVSDQPYTLLEVLLGFVHCQRNDRKAKHHFANALDPGHVTSCLGTEVSLARRAILCFLQGSAKDADLVQKLVGEAEASGDKDTVDLHDKLFK